VPVRVSATDRIRIKIDALFAEDRELSEDPRRSRPPGRPTVDAGGLEAEVTEFLGRGRYQRAAACPDANGGSRNGYRPVTVKTTTGPVTLERPKLRGTTAAFASRLFGKHVNENQRAGDAGDRLVSSRGLSVRDVQATLAETLGDQAAISKSTVSEVCKGDPSRIQAWARRRLDGIMLDYLFWTPVSFGCIPGRRPSRCWRPGASPPRASRCSSGWHPGTGESTDAWVDFLTDLRERGLGCPLLVVSDGAKGLIAAIEQIYQKRCARDVLFIDSGTCSPRFPLGCKPRSATATGPSSTPPI